MVEDLEGIVITPAEIAAARALLAETPYRCDGCCDDCCVSSRAHTKLAELVPGLLDEIEMLRRPVGRPMKVRGVDFPCEKCGALKGSHLDNGWHRCNDCGYPSQ